MEEEDKSVPPTPDIRLSSTTSVVSDNSKNPDTDENILYSLPKPSNRSKVSEWIKSSAIFFPNYFPMEANRLERYGELINADLSYNVNNYCANSRDKEWERAKTVTWMMRIHKSLPFANSLIFKWVRLMDICTGRLVEPETINQELLAYYALLECLDPKTSPTPDECGKFFDLDHPQDKKLKVKNYVQDICTIYKGFPSLFDFLDIQAELLRLTRTEICHSLYILEYNLLNPLCVSKKMDLLTSACLYFVLSIEKSSKFEQMLDNVAWHGKRLRKLGDEMIDFITEENPPEAAVVIEKYSSEKFLGVSKHYLPKPL